MRTASILALLALTPALAGCDIIDIFTGKKTKGQLAYENQQASIATQAEMHAHNQALLATVGGMPVAPPAAPAEPVVAPVAEVPPALVTPPPFECVTIFRVQTCEAGVLYQLDSSMNWILPGRTE
jgi:hypothetical protein